jgi:DNA polymerase III delta subunit
MGTYVQFLNRPAIKRVTWVCGPERVLVESAVDLVRAGVGAKAVDYGSVLAGSCPDREIWALANQYPMNPKDKRLIVVRDAEKITDWGPLENWLSQSRLLPTVHLLFVGSEDYYPHIVRESLRPNGNTARSKELVPPASWIRDKGSVVCCTGLNEKDFRSYVQGRVSASDQVADHLIARCNDSVDLVNNALMKLELFSGEVSKDLVNVLVNPPAATDFVDALVKNDKAKAMRSAEHVPQIEHGKIIGLLNFELEILALLHRELRSGKDQWQIHPTTKLKAIFIRNRFHLAKSYDFNKRKSCSQVLALTDDISRRGQSVGVLESLVALW